jgi:predicted MFS family arabinose efflux permease
MEFTMWAVMPAGAILGGGLATWLGLRETILVAGVGACFAALWVLCSPLRRMRDFAETVGPPWHGGSHAS